MQGFTPNTPVLNSLAVSAVVRDNLMSLLDHHAGASLPAYAVEGMFWYDNANGRHCAVKARGTKPFVAVPMGATITLFATMRQAGLDGSTVVLDARVQDATLLVGDKDWTNVPNQKLYFAHTRPPSFFAARSWSDPLINDPILVCADGVLLGKTWEALAPATHETVFGTGFWSNQASFASATLRAVNMDEDWATWETSFTLASPVDHFVIAPGGLEWFDIQESGGKMILLEDGAEMDPATYRIRPFLSGGIVNLAVYRIDPLVTDLTPFSTTSRYTLRIRKPS
jgi:hypothetical protein